MVPTEAQNAQARSEAGPVATRFTGDLSLDEPQPPQPADRMPGPDRIEVTQPYIPAIRDEQPEFAKRLNPGTANAAPPTTGIATVASPTAPTQPVAEPKNPSPAAPPAAPKRRSLARRAVRRILGPDLLRKDPPKKRS
ncbi:hypothetical protein [Parasphingorhabdus pacifica]